MAKKAAEKAAGAESGKDDEATKKPAEKKAGAVKKAATVDKPEAGKKPNALQQPLQPSRDLAELVGSDPLPRGEVVSKVWVYIKAQNLQNPDDKREIIADEKLKKIFGKDRATMFEMNKYLAQHLK